MVAIHHDDIITAAHRQRSRRQPPRAHLRVLEGGRSPARMAVTYRRRRLAALAAVAVVAALVVLGAGVLVRAGRSLVPKATVAAAPAATAAGSATVVARVGDTLWSIADRLPHHGDVRALVDQLVALNGGSTITPGQRVVVP